MEKYTPPTCPNCGHALTVVDWEEYTTYYFNPETGRYEDEATAGRNPWGGVGFSKCPICSHTLGGSDSTEFEEGPVNYPACVKDE